MAGNTDIVLETRGNKAYFQHDCDNNEALMYTGQERLQSSGKMVQDAHFASCRSGAIPGGSGDIIFHGE